MTVVQKLTHSASAYRNSRCRCDRCRADHLARCHTERQRRVQLLADGLANPTHGKDSTYNNFGCRCGPCNQAHADVSAQQYLRRKAAR
jgi:hypothetical protein